MMSNSWDLSPIEAVALQKTLQKNIRLAPLPQGVRYIAGADISFNKFSDVIYAGIIVLDYDTLQPVLRSTVIDKMTFPYVPGLLSFREIPALLKAWAQLPYQPDVIVLDGHGIAHPRGIGIASHFGLTVSCPAIGCAKKILTGSMGELPPEKGQTAALVKDGKTIGYALRTKDRVKPVFVSPGHLITMEESLAVIQHCTGNYRIPEPTRLAHLLVNAVRRGEVEVGVKYER